MPDPEFVAEPADHRLAKDLVRAGKGLQARYYEPLKLEKRFFKKHHVIQIRAVDAPRSKAIIDGVVVGTHSHASCG